MVLQRKFEINKPEDFHFTMLLTRFTMFLASLLVCAAWQRGETSWGGGGGCGWERRHDTRPRLSVRTSEHFILTIRDAVPRKHFL